ncbi:MAG TPA: HAMP domain-containing sensor histidine kinase [Gemmatimonadales bacterium]|nr:HAMP domain-containing sensor histidine kinase [Gemmatimonadales bacterium]
MSATSRGSYTLLGLLVALVIGLGVEAIRTAEEQRHATDRVLNEYAGLAAWYFRTVWRADWEAQGKSALGPVVAQPLHQGDTLPAVTMLAHVAQDFAHCADPAQDARRFYFRFDHRTGVLTTSGATMDPEHRRALIDSLYPLLELPPMDLFTIGFGPQNQRRVVFAGHKVGPDGRAAATYGLETCLRALGRDALPRVFNNYPLLPPALVGDVPNDSIVSITVTRRAEGGVARETLFVSPTRYPPTYMATVTEGPESRALTFEAHLRPSLASRLVPSRPKGFRVLWLLGLLAATLALAAVVIAQIRREQQLVRARGDFVSSVSHELRTPLAQIRLFAESLKLGSIRTDRDRAGALEVILQESQRLMHLVDNVLHFTRPNGRGRTPFPERIDLSHLVREVVQGFEPLARGRGIRFVVEAGGRVEVQVDPGPTRQILLNLLDNAVKFSPPDLTVTVRCWTEDGWALVSVTDQGPGIPPAERDLIWKPFVRLRANASRAPGSGIGLAVVHDLVERMDGRVSVDSATGGGAVFTVRFPSFRTVTMRGTHETHGGP